VTRIGVSVRLAPATSFEWRDKLTLSFRPQQGLPESEKRRVATRYAPVLLPLVQSVQTAINDLESIATSHRASETKRVEAMDGSED